MAFHAGPKSLGDGVDEPQFSAVGLRDRLQSLGGARGVPVGQLFGGGGLDGGFGCSVLQPVLDACLVVRGQGFFEGVVQDARFTQMRLNPGHRVHF